MLQAIRHLKSSVFVLSIPCCTSYMTVHVTLSQNKWHIMCNTSNPTMFTKAIRRKSKSCRTESTDFISLSTDTPAAFPPPVPYCESPLAIPLTQSLFSPSFTNNPPLPPSLYIKDPQPPLNCLPAQPPPPPSCTVQRCPPPPPSYTPPPPPPPPSYTPPPLPPLPTYSPASKSFPLPPLPLGPPPLQPPLPREPPPLQPPLPSSTPPLSPPPASALPKPAKYLLVSKSSRNKTPRRDANIKVNSFLPLPHLSSLLHPQLESSNMFAVDKMPSKVYIDFDKPRRSRQTIIQNKYVAGHAAGYPASLTSPLGRKLVPVTTFGPIRSHYANKNKTSPELVTLSDDDDEIVCLQETRNTFAVSQGLNKDTRTSRVPKRIERSMKEPTIIDIDMPASIDVTMAKLIDIHLPGTTSDIAVSQIPDIALPKGTIHKKNRKSVTKSINIESYITIDTAGSKTIDTAVSKTIDIDVSKTINTVDPKTIDTAVSKTIDTVHLKMIDTAVPKPMEVEATEVFASAIKSILVSTTISEMTISEISMTNTTDINSIPPQHHSPTTTPQYSPTTTPQYSPTTTPQYSPTTTPQYSPITTPEYSPNTTPSISPQHSPSITPQHSPLITPQHSPSITPQHSPPITPQHSPSITPQHSPPITPQHSPSITPQHSPPITPQHSPSITPQHSPPITPQHSPSITPHHSPSITPQHSPPITPQHSPPITPQHSPPIIPQHSPPIILQHSPPIAPQHSPTTTQQHSVSDKEIDYCMETAGKHFQENIHPIILKKTKENSCESENNSRELLPENEKNSALPSKKFDRKSGKEIVEIIFESSDSEEEMEVDDMADDQSLAAPANGVIQDMDQIDSEYVPLQRVKLRDVVNNSIDLSDEILHFRRKLNQIRLWDKVYISSGQFNRNNRSNDIEFTLMSYNVLAQKLLTDNYSLYKYCDPEYLNWDYRWALLQSEIQAMSPDILTLQEVQSNHYHEYYLPWFTHLGYEGVYKKRTGDKSDGCAIFFLKDKFNLIESVSVEYKQPLTFLDRDNIGIICRLNSTKTNTNLCVATTHLLFNPKRHDIKLAQIQMLLAEVDRISYMGLNNRGHPEYYPLVITGDMNALPHSAVVNFLKTGVLNYFGLQSKTLTPYGGGRILDSQLIPPCLGILDSCQHKGVLQVRCELENTKHISLREKRHKEDARIALHHSERQVQQSSIPGMLPQFTGNMQHQFFLKSVYKHSLDRLAGAPEVTAQSTGWQTVDYILYSQVLSYRNKSAVDGPIKLLASYGLLSAGEAARFGPTPSAVVPSDHFPLAARFLLQADR